MSDGGPEKFYPYVVFLNQENLLKWERPIRSGFISSLPSGHVGSTTLKGFEGTYGLVEDVGPFRINASVAVYLADVLKRDKDNNYFYEGTRKRTPEEELILSGGIQIFRKGIIPGTEIEGLDLERNGKIWYSIPINKGKIRDSLVLHDEWKGIGTVRDLLFLGDKHEGSSVYRVESILRGFQKQEDLDIRKRYRIDDRTHKISRM